jgi:hypothetical protein
MSRCATCGKVVVSGRATLAGPVCHPASGGGHRHPGTGRFPGRRAARRQRRRR